MARTTFNALWNAINALGQMVLSFTAIAIVARIVGPSALGKYFFWLWLANAIALAANNGMASAVSKFGAELIGAGRTESSVRLANNLGRVQLWLSVVLGGVLVLFSLLRPTLLALNDAFAVAFVAVTLTLSGSQTGAATAWQNYRVVAVTRIAQAVVASVLLIVFAIWLKSATWLLVAQGIGQAVGVLLLRLAWSPREESLKDQDASFQPNFKRTLWQFVATTFAISMLGLFVWQRAEVFFLQLMGNPLQIGLFVVAFNLAGALMRIPTALFGVLIPRFSELLGQGRIDWVTNLASKSFRYGLIMGLPLVVFTAAMSKTLIMLLYGTQYADSARLLPFLLFGQLSYMLSHVPRSLLFATNHTRQILVCDGAACVLNCIVQPVAIYFLTTTGAAIANIVSMVWLLGFGTWLLEKHTSISLPWHFGLHIGVWATVWAIPVYVVDHAFGSRLAALATLTVCFSVFSAVCIRLRIMERSDIEALLRTRPGLRRFVMRMAFSGRP